MVSWYQWNTHAFIYSLPHGDHMVILVRANGPRSTLKRRKKDCETQGHHSDWKHQQVWDVSITACAPAHGWNTSEWSCDTQAQVWGRGRAQTESSALVDGSPPLSLRFQFSPASTTLCAHALCAGWTRRLGGKLGTTCTISSGGVGEQGATVHPRLVMRWESWSWGALWRDP